MRTEAELYAVHNALVEHLGTSCKFEERLAMARKIIRLDYHTLDLHQTIENLFSTINEDIVTIKVDTSTPQKVYQEVLANIYRASKLKQHIKAYKKFSKEEVLLLLLHIHFFHHYFQLSQQQIITKLEEANEIDIFDKPLDTTSVNRLLKIAKAIKATTNTISKQDYIVY